jgi:hypothetical protein
MCLVSVLAAVQTAHAYPNGAVVRKHATIELNIYGYYTGELAVSGTSELEWSDWYYSGPQHLMDMQIVSLDLAGSTEGGEPDIHIALNPAVPSFGQSVGEPEEDPFPAESFFDVNLMVSIGPLPPVESYHNELPIHMSAVINDMPPYFDQYTMPPEIIYLYDESGIVRGEITYWAEHCIPWSPPRANLSIATSYGSDVAVVDDGVVAVHGAVTGGLEPSSVEFGIRPAGSGLPFTRFWTDYNGQAPRYATVRPMGSGDGWAGYLDVSAYPVGGGYYEVEGRFHLPNLIDICDSTTVFLDPTPPIPWFVSIPPDSIGYFRPDSLYNIVVGASDEGPGAGYIYVFPMDPERFRTLTPVDRNMLSEPWDSMGCVPAAVASCLKYWADHGHSELEHPNGDENEPEQTGEEMAEELAGEMGTDETGTDDDEMVAGTESYLDSHGCSGWGVDVHPVDNADDIAGMLREFAADSEDVIILVQDTTAEGDTIGHAVTMGSQESRAYEVITPEAYIGCVANEVDFMDPNGGGGTEDNQYPVDYDAQGQPGLSGYDPGESGDGSKITGYMKVSPPAGGGSGSAARTPGAPAQDGWILVSSGTIRGFSQPDTFTWDTTGFPGGVYLLEARMVNAAGHMGSDLRLSGIPQYTVGTDRPQTPQLRLNLKSPYPNPFNPSTTIEYSIPTDGKVTLAIFNVSGALVRRLVDNEPVTAGTHRVEWDGRNDAGKIVASGIYLCTLRSAGSSSSVKLVLMR